MTGYEFERGRGMTNYSKAAKRILGAGNYKLVHLYSGRGMYGAYSVFAITTSEAPDSTAGKKLIKAGLSVDNLGMDYVYYSREAMSEGALFAAKAFAALEDAS